MTQQDYIYQVYDNNDVSSNDTSPMTTSNSKYDNSNNVSTPSSISSRLQGTSDNIYCKMYNHDDCQNYDYDSYYNCFINTKINQNVCYPLTKNGHIEDSRDDNVSECNSLGNATFVQVPFFMFKYQ